MSLSVQGVSVRLDGNDVLSDVSLDVDDDEVVSILGPSGSGKTTLLRVVAGLQVPTAGRVVIDGRDVTSVPPHRRGVGLMFQDHALFPHRDVRGNVGFGLRMAHAPRTEIRDRVDEVLGLVGLDGFGDRRVESLSGGERQRVALARALAPRPSVLLLDEPLGSLDRALRDRLLDDLSDVLDASGATVLHVTHDQGEALATGRRVAVIRRGRLAQVATPEDLWRQPIDADVARIVGPAAAIPVDVAGGRVIAPWGPVDRPATSVDRDGPASLVLRPDDVELATLDDAPRGPRGVVRARSFRGDHVVVRVAVPVGEAEPVELPVVERGGRPVGEVGDEVALVVLAGRGVVVAPDGGQDGPHVDVEP